MKRIQSIPAARTRKTLARSAVLLALALAAPAPAKTLAPGVLFEVTYAYDSLGRPASRTVNGELQTFEYDGRDRLVAVRAEDGSDIERYRYDAAGNILEKTVRGETSRFVYDAANQLVSRTDGSGTTAFAYDAAGRLVREGDRRFVYGNDGHVSRVLEGGAVVASFDYFLDGQVAAVHARGRTERFLWDGLAMVARGDRTFLNEPAVTGGNPVASMGRAFLNDMLGSTVGVHDRKARTRTAVSMTLFGETDADEAYFTGKPELPELGYAFLVRSYRADLGKWQTRDPLGYPDGWNAMAYCKGFPSAKIDLFGTVAIAPTDEIPIAPTHEYLGSFLGVDYFLATSYEVFWDLVGSVGIDGPASVHESFKTEQVWTSEERTAFKTNLSAELAFRLFSISASAETLVSSSVNTTLGTSSDVTYDTTLGVGDELTIYWWQAFAKTTMVVFGYDHKTGRSVYIEEFVGAPSKLPLAHYRYQVELVRAE